MEFNENEMFRNDQDQPVILKEKKQGSTLWYWIITILVLGVLAWFGITSGWFKSLKKDITIVDDTNSMVIEDGSQNNSLVKINSWQIQTTEKFPVEKTLVLSGELPDSCTYIGNIEQTLNGNVFTISVPTYTDGVECINEPVMFEKSIELDVLGLPAGVYVIDINGQEISFELEQDNMLDFEAGSFK